jgi:hypothetical protein
MSRARRMFAGAVSATLLAVLLIGAANADLSSRSGGLAAETTRGIVIVVPDDRDA